MVKCSAGYLVTSTSSGTSSSRFKTGVCSVSVLMLSVSRRKKCCSKSEQPRFVRSFRNPTHEPPTTNQQLASGHYPAGQRVATHRLRRDVVLLTDVLEQRESFLPAERIAARPRSGVGAGIVDRDFVVERVEVRAREALGEMQPRRMWQAVAVHPDLLAEADRVDHQRVAFPATD